MTNSKKILHNQRSVTMHDVARLAGVSQSTVSRVLSQSNSAIPISDDTYRKVMDAVNQLGYFPNITARSLRRQQTEMIAIMIADLSNPFYHYIVRAVQQVASQHKFDLLIAVSNHLYENELHFCEAMMRRPVDGIIMMPYHLTNDDLSTLIQRTGAKIAVLGNTLQHPEIDNVFSDDYKATFDAVQWLIQQKGHTRIGFISVPNAHPSVRRYQGYSAALAEAGIPVTPEYVVEGDWTVESGREAMREMLSLPKPPTALFACNDHMAIGALNYALERQCRVPQDIAIIGFDNIPATTFITPKLTTIDQHPIELGQLLATALFDRITSDYTGETRMYSGTLSLVERDST